MTVVAVFGAGRMGAIHAGNLHSHPDTHIRYIVDVDDSAASQLASRCGARVVTAGEALDDREVAAVVIATSTDTHTGLIQSAAAAGKAIFCEKPIDLNLSKAREAVDAVQAHGVALTIGFNRRHDPSLQKIREGIQAGTVGSVESVSITSRDPSPPPPGYVARSGGIFRDMMIHDFDLVRWLLGEEPTEVFATGSVLIDGDIGRAGDLDSAVAVLKTASGKLCSISNTRRCSFGYDQRIEVFGSLGMLKAPNRTETDIGTADASGFHGAVAMHSFVERYADAYRLQMDKFIRMLNGERVDLPDGADGLKALILADCAQASSASGKSVVVGERPSGKPGRHAAGATVEGGRDGGETHGGDNDLAHY